MKLLTCIKCQLILSPSAFYAGNNSYCKECIRQRTRDYKAERKEASTKILKEREEVRTQLGLELKLMEYKCPFCFLPCQGGPGLLIHLESVHVLSEGKHRGMVLGLDVLPCLLCGQAYQKQLYKHLQSKHATSARAYLNRFPHDLILGKQEHLPRIRSILRYPTRPTELDPIRRLRLTATRVQNAQENATRSARLKARAKVPAAGPLSDR